MALAAREEHPGYPPLENTALPFPWFSPSVALSQVPIEQLKRLSVASVA
jgi:hypothetical protein